MGTVQKIVDSLLKLSDDKKSNLSSRCQEHSVWLGNELSLIRELIQQNPRENSSGKANTKTAAASSSSKSQTAVTEGNEENFSRQKRKSPETALIPSQEEKQSPEQKRFSSSDLEVVSQSAGLPSDLNRLTKEQLLKEVQKRGNKTLSLKVLKQVLIDALKELLLSEQRKDSLSSNFEKIALADSNNNNSSDKLQQQRDSDTISDDHETECTFAAIDSISTDANENAEPVQDMQAVVDALAPEPLQEAFKQTSAVRKGSLMSEFRNMFTGKESAARQQEEQESEESKQHRLKNEFEARQMRHRNSQGGTGRAAEVAKVESSAIAEPVLVAAATVAAKPADKEDHMKSPMKETSIVESSSSPVPTSPDNVWMEVASPVPEPSGSENQRVEEKDASPVVAMDTSSAKEDAPQTSTEAPVIEATSESDKAIDAESVAMPIALSSEVTKVEEVVTTAPIVKKPINLLSQTSFIDKTATKSVIVPALEKARLAKAADEAKLLLKKRELEKKKAAYMAAANQSSTSANGVPSNGANRPPTALPPANSLANGKTVAKPAAIPSASTATSVPRVINGGGLTAAASSATVATIAATSGAATSTAVANPLAAKKGLLAYLDKDKVKASAAINTAAASGPITTEAAQSPVEVENRPVTFSFDISACTLTTLPPVPVTVAVAVAPPAAAEKKLSTPTATIPEDTAAEPASTSSKENSVPALVIAAKPEPVAVDAPAATKPVETVVKAPSVAVITPATAIQAPSQGAKQAAMTSSNSSAKEVLRDISSEVVNANATQVDDDEVSADQYQMDDRESSGSSGSGTDDDNEQEKKKFIPEWAKGTALREALERQYGLGGHTPVDPDLIFPEVQTCSLEEIFGTREGRSGAYAKRTSSAKWDADELTLVEKRTYRSQMGYSAQNNASAMKASAH